MTVVPMFDDLGHKECRRCQAIKPLQDFPARLRPNGNVKFDSYCRPCRKAYQREWYAGHREQVRAGVAARREKERVERSPPEPPARDPLTEAVGFRGHANSRVQGDAGLGIAIAYFARRGVRVGIPLTDSQPYDLMIDDGKELSRVQVRTTTNGQGSGYIVGLKTVGGNKTQVITRVFDPTAYEWLFVVCGDGSAYLIPTTAISARYCIFLGRKYEQYRLVG